jgi:hypothetical protein
MGYLAVGADCQDRTSIRSISGIVSDEEDWNAASAQALEGKLPDLRLGACIETRERLVEKHGARFSE